ncbi:MAG TPA: D-aminoacylase, partial [Thermoanaerobaculia bacterium]
MRTPVTLLLAAILSACTSAAPRYDIVIRNGLIVDGSGSAPRRGDIAIHGDSIAAVGDIRDRGKQEIDAHGLAVAPGFINMLSWAVDSLIVDPRSQSEIRQGVTLEVFGEGDSMGPLSAEMKDYALKHQGDVKYPIEWTTLGEYLDWLTHRGVATNVASFVGATTVRIHEIGFADRPPAPEELARMKDLVRQAMREGALGVGSALIYAPAFYAKTPELIELCKAAGEYGGMYISHIRSEGNRLEEAVDELITIARQAHVPAEIYHLKAAGERNWPKLDSVIRRVNDARASGVRVSADMYTYTAGATGLDAMMPPWVQEGGFDQWRERLQDPALHDRLVREISTPTQEWENLY